MSRYFIDRPIFAWVIAIVMMLAGALAIRSMAIAQFPAIAPPAISVTATYPGADAQTLENTTTQVIEQQMKGLDHLRYFSSTSDSSGTATITLTFEQGTDPDTAQVQVQNKLQLATALLPQEVQQQGLRIAKATANFALIVALYSQDGSHTQDDLADYVAAKIQDPLSRIDGVGDTTIFGSQYAMRIWLDPYKMAALKVTVGDIRAAVQAENAQVSAGQIGGLPIGRGQALNAVVTAQSRLTTAEQFRDIVLRANTDASTVRLRDVARVEIGAEVALARGLYNGRQASGLAIKLAPGANALQTVEDVKAEVERLSAAFPPDVSVAYPLDTTPFVTLSIEEVVKTLIEAVVLVFLVMLLFLQNWRATLIPTIAVPVVLLGAFGVLALAGFTINTLTLFGMVLAIGLLVDDAIVVVENVERLIQEEHLSPRDAARQSMDEVSGALVGIGLVLSAVFLPMAFFGGSAGVIYRQFSITIVSAMALSVMVALILTPALCATILKPHDPDKKPNRFFAWFNRTFDRTRDKYGHVVERANRGWVRTLLVYGVICLGLAFLFLRLPTGFLPAEDQGQVFTQVVLPAGSTIEQTQAVMDKVREHYAANDGDNVAGVFTVAGFSFGGAGQNVGLAFIRLTDWGDRGDAEQAAQAIADRATRDLGRTAPAATVIAFPPPAVIELGNATGFDMQLKGQDGASHASMTAARDRLLGMAMQDQGLVRVRPNGLEDAPQLRLAYEGAASGGSHNLSPADINDTISSAFGGAYINDFIDRGRVKKVFMQADAAYRTKPDDLLALYVRGSTGVMTPLSAIATTEWTRGPQRLERYNGVPSIEILGEPAAGKSSGSAMKLMAGKVKQLGGGFSLEWTGLSYEEQLSGGQSGPLYALSILIVFLCLAALYESWSIPLAVLLVIPLGVIGAVIAATLTGLDNDIYFQVGLITTVGVSAKNAILIVEFAEEGMASGKRAAEAALEAARMRLRPILMTSLAFTFGVFPLAISTGAGAGGRHAIGRAVVGGMISATVLAIFFIPVFFTLLKRLFKQDQPAPHAKEQAA